MVECAYGGDLQGSVLLTKEMKTIFRNSKKNSIYFTKNLCCVLDYLHF